MRAQLVLKFAICAGLVAITAVVFAQTLGHQFLNIDDPAYVTDNPNIRAGLNWQSVVWAFTHVHSHNWHPLTTMSHMLDCQLFGLKPGAHHFVNFLLHSVNGVLLFVLLTQITGRLWSSGFVAAIFAIHPLHVESVAWVSERKDVLSGLFFMLTLLAYVRYVQKQTVGRYVTMSILFACGLMSKPMLVTLPIILVLLDYWPLERFSRSTSARLLVEKIPLGVLSIGSAAATLVVQNEGVGLVRLEVLPLAWRITNALAACLVYIWQTIWPANLALLYPHPGQLPVLKTAGALALLVLISATVFILRGRRPYLFVGWLWYLIMLVPVIGLVQVGSQAHADRYTYLPQIGLCVAATWGIADLSRSFRYRREVLAIAASIVVVVLAWRAWMQTGYWHDTERLWRRTFAVTEKNDLAHFGFGEFLLTQHRLDEAISELQIPLQGNPNDPDVNFQLGSAFMEKGELDLAIRHFGRTLEVEPDNPEAETNLANVLLKSERVEEAIEHYRNIARRDPSSALAQYNLAVGLHRLGQLPEAIAHYKEALALEPNYPDADYFLGQALLENGQPEEAKIHLEKH